MDCSAAARRNLRLGHHIYRRCTKLIMMDLHHIFNAAVILLLHQMVYSNVVNTDTIGILAAKEIFEHEAQTEFSSPSSKAAATSSGVPATGYASDCLSVLNDLAELVAQIRLLRFPGSEHVNTGLYVGGFGMAGIDDLGSAAHGRGGSSGNGIAGPHRAGSLSSAGLPYAPSEEELAANLGLENPYGSGECWYGNKMIQQREPHTNQKEMEQWVHTCREDLTGPSAKFTGM